MSGHTLRRVVAALCAAALIVAGSAGAGFAAETADSFEASLPAENATSPAVLDVLILRPLGIGMLAVGTALAVPATVLTAITRPKEIYKPIQTLIVAPARYVWVDPIGKH